MKYLLIGVAGAALCHPFAASAGDQHQPSFKSRIGTSYLSINAGITSAGDTDFNAATGTDVETEYDEGYVISAEVGHNVGPLYFIDNVKLGVEAAYSGYDVDTHSTGGVGLSGADGDLHASTLMANMYHEYNTNTRFVPYYGLGVGLAYLQADDYGTTVTGTALDDEDIAFAYQGTAGVSYILDDYSDIGIRYRYTGTEGAELRGEGGGASDDDFDYDSHAFTIGYSYKF